MTVSCIANVGSQIGMMHTGISNTGFARILVSSNTPAPAKSSMQASANRMSHIVQKVNKEDMAHIREDIKMVQYALGRDTIDVEMDARYSNPTHSGVGNTPYQAATQMTQIVAENLTKEKKSSPGTVKVSYVKCVHW